MKEKVSQLIRAGVAGIYIHSAEEQRVEALLLELAQERKRSLFVWSCTQGLRQMYPQAQEERRNETSEPLTALERICALDRAAIVVLRDFHEFLHDPMVRRAFRDATAVCRGKKVALVIVGARVVIPPEIEKEITLIEFSLPGRDELNSVLEYIISQAQKAAQIPVPTEAEREELLEAAAGLTTQEAEDIFTLSLVSLGKFDASFVAREKAQAVKRTGLLEFYEPEVTLDDIGGLQNIKRWLSKRRRAFSSEAREFGLPEPKGILTIGIPGSGKSLTAKACSAVWQRPLLRLDVGRLFGSLVGESEANLRSALATAEAIAPCILWLDELEKAFSREQGSLDGGTSMRVFGGFLTWMQEKRKPVFVFATANQIRLLPPELMRKGRFDEIFFVDLPSKVEREEIFKIHLEKRGRQASSFQVATLAEKTSGWTGAEIEQVVIDALFDAFDANRELEQSDLEAAVARTVPLSQTMKEDIAALRQWARGRAVMASPEETDALPEVGQVGRAIEI